MVVDKRVKGCPNENCSLHKEKLKQKPDMNYCPMCGEKLVFVCAKCFCEIENIDYDHRICALCEVKRSQKKGAVAGAAKDGAKAVGKLALGVAVGVGGKAIPQLQKGMVSKYGKIAVDVGKKILKL